jgi:hypothetical protein
MCASMCLHVCVCAYVCIYVFACVRVCALGLAMGVTTSGCIEKSFRSTMVCFFGVTLAINLKAPGNMVVRDRTTFV